MSDCDQIDVLLEDLLGEKQVLPEPYFAEEEYDIAAMVADMRASGNWGEIFPDLFVPLPVCQLLRKSHKVKRGPGKGRTRLRYAIELETRKLFALPAWYARWLDKEGY